MIDHEGKTLVQRVEDILDSDTHVDVDEEGEQYGWVSQDAIEDVIELIREDERKKTVEWARDRLLSKEASEFALNLYIYGLQTRHLNTSGAFYSVLIAEVVEGIIPGVVDAMLGMEAEGD